MLNQHCRRLLNSSQGPLEARQHLGPAALSGGMVVNREVWLHPAVRCGVGFRPVTHAGLRHGVLKSLCHLSRIAAVVRGSGNIDLGPQPRSQQVGLVGASVARLPPWKLTTAPKRSG